MKACDGFEEATSYLADKWKLSDGMKGATLNAIGSSMPELLITAIFLFMFADTTGFAGGIGTTAGSAVFNTAVIPAAVILVMLWKSTSGSVNIPSRVIWRDGLTLIAAEFFLIVFMGDTLNWYHGAMLMLIYISYVGVMYTRHKITIKNSSTENIIDVNEGDDEDDNDEPQENENNSFLKSFLAADWKTAFWGESEPSSVNQAWGILGASTLAISLACILLVHGTESLAHIMGIPGYFTAVILAAAASSLPDTILSMKDAKNGEGEDALSNALGSNIFDICFALGAPLFVYTIMYGPIVIPPEILLHITELRILLLILTIIAFLIFISGKLTKIKAYGLISIYVLFTAYIVGRGMEASWAEGISSKLHLLQSFIQ
jgi:cation:H+ antiporter